MWPSDRFFEAKLAEQRERHHRYDDTAYKLTKTYWEQKDAMGSAAAWWNGVDSDLMQHITGKIHPGAAKYYKEIGWALTDAQM